MNGQLQAYKLLLKELGDIMHNVYVGWNLSVTVSDLIPSATYEFLVVVSTNGGSTWSPSSNLIMPTITPPVVPPPQILMVLSHSQIFIAWSVLTVLEGYIDQYRVLLNFGKDTEVTKGVGRDLSVTISDLIPYTEYEVRLQACLNNLQNNCGTSSAVYNLTFEAPPFGQSAPVLTAIASDAVHIEYYKPLYPNGVIRNYHIYQRQVSVEVLINQLNGNIYSFTYSGQNLKPFTLYEFGVRALNSQGQTEISYATVMTLESPPEELLPPLVNLTSAYGIVISWKPPLYPNGIITTYRILYHLRTFSFVDKKFVTVSGNVIETTLGGLEPFSDYLICLEANNSAGSVTSSEVNIFTPQASPSGLSAFTVEKLTSGTGVILHWNSPLIPNGIITMYRVYESETQNILYGGIGQVFEYQRLLPFSNYSVQLEICTIAGCTTGEAQTFITAEIAPSAQPTPKLSWINATHALLLWSGPVNSNGKITSFEVYRRNANLQLRNQTDESFGEVVYKTTETNSDTYQYMDLGLQPYTQYEYRIRTANSEGFTDSSWLSIHTNQAPPQGVSSPIVSFVDRKISSLMVSWAPPIKVNGILQNYCLQKNESVLLSFPPNGTLEYVFEGLEPYTYYSFILTACSAGGCTASKPTILRTLEAAPLSVQPPAIFVQNSTSILASWEKPQISNGEINFYRLNMDNIVVYEGLALMFLVGSLIPHQEYTFRLTSCTNGGCTQSFPIKSRTDSAPPTGLALPVLRVVSATAIEVSWSQPQNPNGIISSYDVRRDGQLVFTTSISSEETLQTSYTDHNLHSGEQYSYTVIVHNDKGSAESPVSKAETYSSSPVGLSPPSLTPLSSTSVQVSWAPPISPNGQIANYSLYQKNKLIFSGGPLQLNYIVSGLDFFRLYSFRLQTCTLRGCSLSEPSTVQTLEALPEQQEAPSLMALANEVGAHYAVYVSWQPPLKPNGIILYYQLQRRIVIIDEVGPSYGSAVQIYNGTNKDITDSDLQPHQQYHYMVTSVNSVGEGHSPWVSVTTKQSPPTSVDPPVIVSKTSTTITVQVSPIQQPNGVVRLYSIMLNGTTHASGLALQLTVGEVFPLSPYTTYSIQIQACTSGGCTNSTSVLVTTAAAKPAGIDPITITASNSSSILLSWKLPSHPNGAIQKFMVYQRKSCPPTAQPYTETCKLGSIELLYEGLKTEIAAVNLTPYTAYEFQLQAENEIGRVDSLQWVRAETASTEPIYFKEPILFKNGTLTIVNWTGSFTLNGCLQEYRLKGNKVVIYRGLQTVYGVERRPKNEVINFNVEAENDRGVAESPVIIFDPDAINNIGITTSNPLNPTLSLQEKYFYEEIWFITMIVIIGFLLLFLVSAVCFRHSKPVEVYIRERMPLQSPGRELPRDLFVIDAADGSIIDKVLPSSAKFDRSFVYQGSGPGITNPAFVNGRSLLDFSSDKSSTVGQEAMEDDISWDKNFHSGLNDEDYMDCDGDMSYSYIKQGRGGNHVGGDVLQTSQDETGV